MRAVNVLLLMLLSCADDASAAARCLTRLKLDLHDDAEDSR